MGKGLTDEKSAVFPGFTGILPSAPESRFDSLIETLFRKVAVAICYDSRRKHF